MRCINTGGVDWIGNAFRKRVDIGGGKVQALWCGIQVPKDAAPGTYEGIVKVKPKNAKETSIKLTLHVGERVLDDAGDSEPWRYSRLRWLDSTLAVDDEPVAPYTPMTVQGKTVGCLGRTVTLGEAGLPASIRSFFSPSVTGLVDKCREVLAVPMRFVAEMTDGKTQAFTGTTRITKRASGIVAWSSTAHAGDLKLKVRGEMEFDGHLEYRVELSADKATQVMDIRLEVPYEHAVAKYMMGNGAEGRRT